MADEDPLGISDKPDSKADTGDSGTKKGNNWYQRLATTTNTLALVDILTKSTNALSSAYTTVEITGKSTPQDTKSLEEKKAILIKELLAAGIDPALFDTLMSNSLNRRLKVGFGVAFLALTFLFTAASYAIVALNGIHKWGISDTAITGLIIETPIQFVGILYIIARNLFPIAEKPTSAGKL